MELADRFALHRKFDMGVNGVDFGCGRVAHERHADLLEDAGLHQSCCECMSEIVETDMPDLGVLQGRFPGALYDADRVAAKLDHEALGLAVFP